MYKEKIIDEEKKKIILEELKDEGYTMEEALVLIRKAENRIITKIENAFKK